MVKLLRMVDEATIVGCRQKVDFYFWMGIPVARSWPRKSTQPRTVGEVASSEEFKAAARWTADLSPNVKEDYQTYAKGGAVTWVDMQRALMRGKPWFRVEPLGNGP